MPRNSALSLAAQLLAGGLLAVALAACGDGVPQIRMDGAGQQPAGVPAQPAASQPAALSQASAAASAPGGAGASASANAADLLNQVRTAAAGDRQTSSGNPAPAASTPAPGQPVPAAAASHALPAGARLEIPSIGVDAPMVTLGVDPDGTMQVPNNGVDVGWYTFSAVPGMAGNAVISGHLDTPTSTTAVFTRLKDLKEGDDISVATAGKQTDYQVFWSKSWSDAAAPLALILGNAPSPTITLITCAGTWDRTVQNYSERLVVRGKLPGSI